MSKYPPNEEEILLSKAIEKDKKTPLQLGQKWYMISEKWYSKLKAHLNYKTIDKPKCIDNSDLFDHVYLWLRDNLVEDEDFFLVSEETWKLFCNLYTCAPDSEIEVPVISDGIEGKEILRCEIYGIRLKISRLKKDRLDTENQIYLTISRKATIKDLKTLILSKFKIKKSCRLNLWNYFDEQQPVLLKDENQTIEDAKLVDKQHIVLEVKSGLKKNFAKIVSKIVGGVKTATAQYTQSPRKEAPVRGLCGLQNLGNTCFMNSALQCLSNTPELTNYFLQNLYVADINEINPLGTKGKLAKQYASLIKSMWNGNRIVAPRDFKLSISKFAPQFSGYSQHDSQELLAYLLDGLHEDLNRIKNKPYVETKDHNGRDDEVVANEAWEDHLRRNKSIIVDLFQGQLKSTLRCPDCEKISIKFDPFLFLSTSIPDKTCVSIMILAQEKHDARFVKYVVNLPSNATIKDLKNEFTQGLKTEWSNREFILADMNTNRIHSIMKDDQFISEIKSKDKILCFNVPPNEHIRINIVQRSLKQNHEKSTKSPYQLLGIPFILFVPQNCTSRQLYQMAYESIARFTQEEVKFNIDDPFFVLSHVNSLAYTCGLDCKVNDCFGCPIVVNDDVLNLSNDDFIAIDWIDRKMCNEKEAMTVNIAPQQPTTTVSDNSKVTLEDCLNHFSATEQLEPNNEWYCPQCKELKRAWKKFEIWKLPNILIIHLKRFVYNSRYRRKLDTFVEFPLEGLDMSPFMAKKTNEPQLYDLFAVSNHTGGMGGGHYYSYAKNCIDNNWYEYNDSHVSIIEKSNVISPTGYVLFYKKRK